MHNVINPRVLYQTEIQKSTHRGVPHRSRNRNKHGKVPVLTNADVL